MIPLPFVIGGIAGLALAGRTKPRAKFSRMKILGPQTGIAYEVDVCPGGAVLIVHAGGSSALFQKIAGAPGYELLRQLTGSRDAVELMKRDLSPQKKAEP